MRLRVALALALLLPLTADASIVVLKDGSRLRGEVIGGDSTGIHLRTPDGNTMHVLNEQIERIEAEPQPAAAPGAETAPEGAAPPPPPPYRHGGWRRVAVQERPFGKGSQELTAVLGIAIPVSSIDLGIGGTTISNGGAGPLIGVQYLYQLSDQFGIGPEFDFFHRSGHHSDELVPSAVSEVSGDSFLLMGVARWLFTTTGTARPYISAGVGAHHSTTFVDAFPQPGFVWGDTGTDETRRLVDGGIWRAAVSLRAGVDFISRDSIAAFEAGWSHLGSGPNSSTAAGRFLGIGDVDAKIDAVMVNFRVGGRF